MSDCLDQRALEILCHVVESYLETGEPVGSKTLSQRLGIRLSSATIRNVMADLEQIGLLSSPHTSAGRMPTDAGLRFVVNGFLELRELSTEDRNNIEGRCQPSNKSLSQLFEDTSLALSGLSACAGLVFAPKTEARLKHVEFVFLKPGRALVVLVIEGGQVENRIIEIPKRVMPFHLEAATNYLNAHLGTSLQDVRGHIQKEFETQKAQLDTLAQALVDQGLAAWSGLEGHGGLIVRGQSNLLKNVRELEELENLQSLLHTLDTQEGLLELLDTTIEADGVQIFIGSENTLFELGESSVVMAPYKDAKGGVVGAIGVVGPTYMNYRRIIPIVDYTARLLGKVVG